MSLVPDIALTIAYYVWCGLLPIFAFRALRMWPAYIKTGKLGDKTACAFEDNFSIRAAFLESHPMTIAADMGTLVVATIALLMLSRFLIFIVPSILLYHAIKWLAIRARERYVKKQEFHEKLKNG